MSSEAVDRVLVLELCELDRVKMLRGKALLKRALDCVGMGSANSEYPELAFWQQEGYRTTGRRIDGCGGTVREAGWGRGHGGTEGKLWCLFGTKDCRNVWWTLKARPGEFQKRCVLVLLWISSETETVQCCRQQVVPVEGSCSAGRTQHSTKPAALDRAEEV